MSNLSYTVYPRLPKIVAQKVAEEICNRSVEILYQDSTLTHSSAIYAPTGNRVQRDKLKYIQEMVRSCAEEYGYPNPQETDTEKARGFDATCSILLHKNLDLSPTEAAHIEMWAFMTCVMLPDVVRWRYYGDLTAIERFIGSNRGLRRNTFGRLWWRAFLLYQPELEDPYELVPQLNEDDYSALMERASIASDPALVTAASRVFLKFTHQHPDISRRDIVREGAKRIRRLLSLIAFEAMDELSVQKSLEDVFSQTVFALRAELE